MDICVVQYRTSLYMVCLLSNGEIEDQVYDKSDTVDIASLL